MPWDQQRTRILLLVHASTLVCAMQDIAACRDAASQQRADVDEGLLAMSDEALQAARVGAYAAADALLLTDAPLLFTHGQLALAAVRSACSKVVGLQCMQQGGWFAGLLQLARGRHCA
jgi:hypothetical protein